MLRREMFKTIGSLLSLPLLSLAEDKQEDVLFEEVPFGTVYPGCNYLIVDITKFGYRYLICFQESESPKQKEYTDFRFNKRQFIFKGWKRIPQKLKQMFEEWESKNRPYNGPYTHFA